MNNIVLHSRTKRFLNFLHQTEDIMLVTSLLLMILTAVIQLLLRNFFDSGVVWANSMVRILVLWCGLLGAMIATRQKSHISIDLISRYLPENGTKILDFIIQLFTGTVCAIMAYFSLVFVQMEFEFGEMAFAAVPAWLCQAIIPFALAIMALRCFIFSLTSIYKLFHPVP